jgi:hypothetical protein
VPTVDIMEQSTGVDIVAPAASLCTAAMSRVLAAGDIRSRSRRPTIVRAPFEPGRNE